MILMALDDLPQDYQYKHEWLEDQDLWAVSFMPSFAPKSTGQSKMKYYFTGLFSIYKITNSGRMNGPPIRQ